MNDYLSVEIRWLIIAQASSGRAFLITRSQVCTLVARIYLRFDTATNNINGPSRANQRTDRGIPENYRFDRLQSLVRFDRSQDRFPQVSIHLSRMNGIADESVIEHVACAGYVIGVVVSGQ